MRQRIVIPGLVWVLMLAGVAALLWTGTALAAQFVGDDQYELPRGEVIADDLYVSGGEVFINGTVEGDLVVAGGYVEVNGVVMGDVIAAGGAVIIAGVVQDDVRAAGGAIVVTGSVGDDLIAAAGGGWPGMIVSTGERTLPQGLQIASGATIGGDAYVAGGQGVINGSIGGDLVTGMRSVQVAARVGRNARLYGETVRVDERTRVQGELRYQSATETNVPDTVAARVIREATPEPATAARAAQRNPVWGFLGWATRSLLVFAGLALVGWLLWSFRTARFNAVTQTMDDRPVESAVYGLLVAVLVIPVSAALTFLGVLFWGWFPGGAAMLGFTFGLFALLWLISPAVTGLWVGRKVARALGVGRGDVIALVLGIAVIVLLARVLVFIPFVGELVFRALYLLSFALAVGAWLLERRKPTVAAVLPVTETAEPSAPAAG